MARFGRAQPPKPHEGYPINGTGYLYFTSKLLQQSSFAILQESGGYILLQQIFTPASNSIKTFDGLAYASTKTIGGLALSSVKTWNGLA